MNYLMLIKGNEKCLIHETDYTQEQKLREMVEESPELINLPEIEKGSILLPVAKEFKASDLICVDNHGRIIVLEFKLEKNQTMRDIVAQILDYASTIWKTSYEEFNNSIKGYIKEKYGNEDLATVFFEKFMDKLDLTEFEGDEEKWKSDFREKIVSNLNNGIFKLVIYANKMPDEIRRVAEYLYSVHHVDIHCVEVDYFQKEGLKILIPKHFDMGKQQATKPSTSRRTWSWEEFRDECNKNLDKKQSNVIEELYKFGVSKKQLFETVTFGTGLTGSFTVKTTHNSKNVSLYSVFGNGIVQIPLEYFLTKDEIKPLGIRYRKQLNNIQGINLKENLKYPIFKVEALTNTENMKLFKEIVNDVVMELKNK